MAGILNDEKTILFIGDSITDCGRRKEHAPFGLGYVKFFHDMLISRKPGNNITVINRGIGGNTVVDLQNRWCDDAISIKPDLMSIKIGINDLHRVLRNPDPKEHVTPEIFEKTYDEILSRVKAELPGCKLLLIDPFYISTDNSPESFRKKVLDLIPQYIEIVHKMSEKYQTRLIKTHDIFQNLLKYYDTNVFCAEPVHPNLTGHLVIAEAVYNALSE